MVTAKYIGKVCHDAAPPSPDTIVLAIEWQGWAILAYLTVFLIGVVLSFALRKSERRGWVRTVTFIVFIPMFFVASLIFMIISPLLRKTPTLAELQRDFASKQKRLELLVHMSDEDSSFTRIAPNFVDHPSNPSELGRYSEGDPRALPKPRWDEYRTIYDRIKVDSGLERDQGDDVFIMMDSYGMWDGGKTSGYVFCSPESSISNGYRLPPCVLRQHKGEKKLNGRNSQGYSFSRIAANWYAYIEESA